MDKNKTKKIPNIVLTAVFLLIVLASLLTLLLQNSFSSPQKNAKIYCDGSLIKEINLEQVESSYTIKVNGCVILVEKGYISVTSADCPDKLCVKQKKISSGVVPIVCLPNKVMITVENAESNIDAVVG